GFHVTGVQTCALPIFAAKSPAPVMPLCIALAVVFGGAWLAALRGFGKLGVAMLAAMVLVMIGFGLPAALPGLTARSTRDLCEQEIGRASCRERVEIEG